MNSMIQIDGQEPTEYIEKIAKRSYDNGRVEGFIVGIITVIIAILFIHIITTN